MRFPAAPVLLLVAGLGLARPALAQGPTDAPLEQFVQQVARLWSSADVAALVELMRDDRLLLDTGAGVETANGRRAATILRALFSERETMDARPVRATLATASPPGGFGELAWSYRLRGTPGEQTRTLYVAALWDGEQWRISELRVIP